MIHLPPVTESMKAWESVRLSVISIILRGHQLDPGIVEPLAQERVRLLNTVVYST